MLRRLEIFAEGLRFPEGPTIDVDGRLCVVELAAGTVRRFDSTGSVHDVVQTGGAPNGLALGADGELFVCNNGGHWIAEPCTSGVEGAGDGPGLIQLLHRDGHLAVLLATIDGVPLDAPNDICVDAGGGLWFTDPKWLRGTQLDPGSVCYLAPGGEARRVVTDLAFPNGIGITPDGSTLVVCESAKGRVVAFPIEGPGQLGARFTWGYLGRGTVPDGLCFDSSGRLLVAGQATSRIFVFPPGGGELEDTIDIGTIGVTNVCFGGPDWATLYITESHLGRVLALTWDRPGATLGAPPL